MHIITLVHLLMRIHFLLYLWKWKIS